ncbi:MAG: hypothetical protein IPJ98_09465 [Bryobacterales bacterium]|nr:hypothetical protein [Bryobacterales bacterium]
MDDGEVVFFLDAEGGAGDVDVVGGELVDGVVFAALLEGGFAAKDFAHDGDLFGGVMPPMEETRQRTKSMRRWEMRG